MYEKHRDYIKCAKPTYTFYKNKSLNFGGKLRTFVLPFAGEMIETRQLGINLVKILHFFTCDFPLL